MNIWLSNEDTAALTELAESRNELTEQCAANLIRENLNP
jgi:hypothetical protein